MKRLSAWLAALAHWLAEARLLWTGLFVVLLALLVCIRPGAREIDVRVTGLVLQWLGIGTVAVGIRETRRLFGRPGIGKLFVAWVSRFPRWRRQVVFGAGAGALGTATASARGYVWTTIDPTAPVETRLNALTRNVERLNERLIQVQNELESELRKHSEALRSEQNERAQNDQQLHLRLEAAETGGLYISAIGLVWLIVGVFLTTMSPEIGRWVQ